MGLRRWYMGMSRSKRVILICFLIWVVQAVPKWGFVILADGEVAGDIMRYVITPKIP
jgi:hypothetical protein